MTLSDPQISQKLQIITVEKHPAALLQIARCYKYVVNIIIYIYIFHKKCLNDKLIPKGFWSLEPSIRNHDDEFLQQWYEDVTKFLLTRMEATVKFCKKTITAAKSSINETENELKRKTVPTTFNEVEKK